MYFLLKYYVFLSHNTNLHFHIIIFENNINEILRAIIEYQQIYVVTSITEARAVDLKVR